MRLGRAPVPGGGARVPAAPDAASTSRAAVGAAPAALPDLVARLLRLGPELLAEASPRPLPDALSAAVEFWQAVWEALRLEERYVPLEALDTYEIAPGISGELLRPIVEANGDVRMHVSNGAAASFADTLRAAAPARACSSATTCS